MRLKPLDQHYGWPTTRRHPRSMREAFPFDYEDSVEHCPSAASWLLNDFVLGALLLAVLAALLLGVLR